MWSRRICLLLICFFQIQRDVVADESLTEVWNAIVTKSADRAQCQSCVSTSDLLEQTVLDDEIKSIRIEAFKKKLLKTLGMKQAPKFHSNDNPLPQPIKTVLSLKNEEITPSHPVTERVIILFSSHDYVEGIGGCDMNLKLEIPSNLNGIDISGAHLWIYTEMTDTLETCFILASPCENARETSLIPLQLSSFKDGWNKIDITWTLSSWMELNTMCHHINLSCNSQTICEESISYDPTRKPFIHVDVALHNLQAKREKRNLNCGKGTTECCRESLQISFKDIGWDDWIIQPTNYNAYYCKGTCANAATISLSKAPYRTIMRKYNLIPQKQIDVTPCCTPARLSPLQVIYKDQNNTYLQRIIPDLTVESCGCM